MLVWWLDFSLKDSEQQWKPMAPRTKAISAINLTDIKHGQPPAKLKTIHHLHILLICLQLCGSSVSFFNKSILIVRHVFELLLLLKVSALLLLYWFLVEYRVSCIIVYHQDTIISFFWSNTLASRAGLKRGRLNRSLFFFFFTSRWKKFTNNQISRPTLNAAVASVVYHKPRRTCGYPQVLLRRRKQHRLLIFQNTLMTNCQIDNQLCELCRIKHKR